MSMVPGKIPPVVGPPRGVGVTAEQPMLSYQHPAPPAVPEGWTNVRIYGYRPEKMGEYVRAQFIRQSIASSFLLVVVMLGEARAFSETPELMLGVILFLLLIGGLSWTFRFWRTRRTIAQQWPTFRIFVADQGVCRVCRDFQPLVLRYEAIKEIREFPGKGLRIKGRRGQEVIMARAGYVENYAELREVLAAAVPLKPPGRFWLVMTRVALLTAVYLAVVFGGLAWGLVTTDWRAEWVCVLAVVSGVGAMQYFIWRSPNVPLMQKLQSLAVFMSPMMLVAKVLARWKGFWF